MNNFAIIFLKGMSEAFCYRCFKKFDRGAYFISKMECSHTHFLLLSVTMLCNTLLCTI